jgi:hypothetical protein
MEEILRFQLKINKARELQNPIIIMNDKDLQDFIGLTETKVRNFKAGEAPTYEGIPMKGTATMERGNIAICDKPLPLPPR